MGVAVKLTVPTPRGEKLPMIGVLKVCNWSSPELPERLFRSSPAWPKAICAACRVLICDAICWLSASGGVGGIG